MMTIVFLQIMVYYVTMNYRDYKTNFEGGYFHDLNRGANKQQIFFEKSDFQRFTDLMSEAFLGEKSENSSRKCLPAGSYNLLVYAQMPNHFHFIVKQNTEIPVGVAMKKIQGGYAKFFNTKYKRSGGVFEDQFKHIDIDSDIYLRWVIGYVLLNPYLAGLENNFGDYPYSSLHDLLWYRTNKLTNSEFVMDLFDGKDKLISFLNMAALEIKNRKDLQKYLLDHNL